MVYVYDNIQKKDINFVMLAINKLGLFVKILL